MDRALMVYTILLLRHQSSKREISKTALLSVLDNNIMNEIAEENLEFCRRVLCISININQFQTISRSYKILKIIPHRKHMH